MWDRPAVSPMPSAARIATWWYDPSRGRDPAWAALSFLLGKFCRLFEYLHKHVSRQLASLRVLIRGMI